jgi:hypothetical protein
MCRRRAYSMCVMFAMLALAALLSSCSFLTQFLPREREAQRRALHIRNLQLSVMRFADEYSGRVGEAIGKFQQRTQVPGRATCECEGRDRTNERARLPEVDTASGAGSH